MSGIPESSASAPCKGCQADVRVTERQIARMLAAIEAGSFDLVPDERYAERLAACLSCDSLQYGTTCAYCGCIVHVRAKLADKGCPKPGASKW
nr:hypothetical protein [Paenibacillus humicola]